jgi:hypothetical protein
MALLLALKVCGNLAHLLDDAGNDLRLTLTPARKVKGLERAGPLFDLLDDRRVSVLSDHAIKSRFVDLRH